MRVAPLTRYSIDRLDLLRAELEQELHRIRYYLMLADTRAERAVDLLVHSIDDPRRMLEKRDLFRGLDRASAHHHRLRVRRLDSLTL